MSAIKNLARARREELAECDGCADLTVDLDRRFPHYIDYLNGEYGTIHRQECWSAPSTFTEALVEQRKFHEGGHRKI